MAKSKAGSAIRILFPSSPHSPKRNGYAFEVLPGIGKGCHLPKVDACEVDFVAVASPVRPGETGRKVFATNSSGPVLDPDEWLTGIRDEIAAERKTEALQEKDLQSEGPRPPQ